MSQYPAPRIYCFSLVSASLPLHDYNCHLELRDDHGGWGLVHKNKKCKTQKYLCAWKPHRELAYLQTLLFPGTWCTWKSVCTFQEWGLCLSQSTGAPVHKPHWSPMSNAQGDPPTNVRSPGEETLCGTQDSHSRGWYSAVQLLSSLWAAHLVVIRLLVAHNHPSYCL